MGHRQWLNKYKLPMILVSIAILWLIYNDIAKRDDWESVSPIPSALPVSVSPLPTPILPFALVHKFIPLSSPQTIMMGRLGEVEHMTSAVGFPAEIVAMNVDVSFICEKYWWSLQENTVDFKNCSI